MLDYKKLHNLVYIKYIQ